MTRGFPRWAFALVVSCAFAGCGGDGPAAPLAEEEAGPEPILSLTGSFSAPESVEVGERVPYQSAVGVWAQHGTASLDSVVVWAARNDSLMDRRWFDALSFSDTTTYAHGEGDVSSLERCVYASARNTDHTVFEEVCEMRSVYTIPPPDSMDVEIVARGFLDKGVNLFVEGVLHNFATGEDVLLENVDGVLSARVVESDSVGLSFADPVNRHRVDIPLDPDTDWNAAAREYFGAPDRFFELHMLTVGGRGYVFDAGASRVVVSSVGGLEGVLETVEERFDYYGSAEWGASRTGVRNEAGVGFPEFRGVFAGPDYGADLKFLVARGGSSAYPDWELVGVEHERVWDLFVEDLLSLVYDPLVIDPLVAPFRPGQLSFAIVPNEEFASYMTRIPDPHPSQLLTPDPVDNVQAVIKNFRAREKSLYRLLGGSESMIHVPWAVMSGPIIHPNNLHSELNLFGGRYETTWWSTWNSEPLSCHQKRIHRNPACPSTQGRLGRLTHMDPQTEDAYQVFLTFDRNKRLTQGENLRLFAYDAPFWWGHSTPPWFRE